MDELFQTPSPESAAEYEAAVDQLLAEMGRLNHQMRADRAEIERLRAETRELKRETRAVLESLGCRL